MTEEEQDLVQMVESGGGIAELTALARSWAATDKAGVAAELLLGIADSAVRAGRAAVVLDLLLIFDEVAGHLQLSTETRAWRLRLEGIAWMDRGDLARARDLAEAALTEADATGQSELVVPVALQAGGVALELGDADAAEDRFRQALQLARRLGDVNWIAQAFVNLANVALDRGELETAKGYLDEAEATGATRKNAHLLSSIVGTRGTIAARETDWESAERLNRNALAAARRSGDAMAEIVALQNLGSVLVEAGRMALGLRWYRKAIVLADGVGAQRKAAEVHAGFARALFDHGRLHEAGEHFRAGRALFDLLGDPLMAARMIADLGAVEAAADHVADAEALLHQAASELAELGDNAWNALAHSNLAELRYRQGDFNGAAARIDSALQLLAPEDHQRRSQMFWRQAAYLTGLGTSERLENALRNAVLEDAATLQGSQLAWQWGLAAAHVASVGDHESALRFLTEGVELAGNDPEATFHLRNDRGITLMELGRLEESLAEFNAAMRLAIRRHDRVMQVLAAQNLGETLRRLGSTKDAVRQLEKGAQLADAVGDSVSHAAILGNLGIALTDVGEVARAEEAFHRAVTIGQSIDERGAVAIGLGGLAGLAFRASDYRRAADLYEQATLERHEGTDRHTIEDLAGWVESLAASGQTRKLTRAAQELVTAAQASGWEDLAWPALANAGRWYATRRRFDRAADLYAIAIVIAGTSGKIAFGTEVEALGPGVVAMMEGVILLLAHGEVEGFPRAKLVEKVQVVLAEQYGLPSEPIAELFAGAMDAWSSLTASRG